MSALKYILLGIAFILFGIGAALLGMLLGAAGLATPFALFGLFVGLIVAICGCTAKDKKDKNE